MYSKLHFSICLITKSDFINQARIEFKENMIYGKAGEQQIRHEDCNPAYSKSDASRNGRITITRLEEHGSWEIVSG
jgi:hypothetical protein